MRQRLGCGDCASLFSPSVGLDGPNNSTSRATVTYRPATRVPRQGIKRPNRLARQRAMEALAGSLRAAVPGLSSDGSSSDTDDSGVSVDSDSDYSAPRVKKRCRGGSLARASASTTGSPERPFPRGVSASVADTPRRVRATDLHHARTSSDTDGSCDGTGNQSRPKDPDYCAARVRRQWHVPKPRSRSSGLVRALHAAASDPTAIAGSSIQGEPSTGSSSEGTARARRRLGRVMPSQRRRGRDCASLSSLSDDSTQDGAAVPSTVIRGQQVALGLSQSLLHSTPRAGAGSPSQSARQRSVGVRTGSLLPEASSHSSCSSLSDTEESGTSSGSSPDLGSPRASLGRRTRSTVVSRVRSAPAAGSAVGRPQRERQLAEGRLAARGALSPSMRRGQVRSLVTPSRSAKVNFVLRQPVNFGLPEVCPHCHASVWRAERSNGAWICCGSGQEVLPASLFPPVEPELRELYSQRKFSFHSRSINNHLAFTSIGTTPNTTQGGRGMNFRLPFPSSARLQGKTYHVLSATTQYAQGYGPNLYYIQVSWGRYYNGIASI